MSLALPKCDKCGHKWYARYRRNKPPTFYCQKCGRKHPVWTSEMILSVQGDADKLIKKVQPLLGGDMFTKEQKEVLKHALGLNRSNKPYRNYYIDRPEARVCTELVNKGAMVKGQEIEGGLVCYHVTNFGQKLAVDVDVEPCAPT